MNSLRVFGLINKLYSDLMSLVNVESLEFDYVWSRRKYTIAANSGEFIWRK